jgi:ParD-like antitoxin of type II bacterial toxin-antitoxin system
MHNTINISDQLLSDAILVVSQTHRSLSDQIEHWAQLGKTIEPFFTANQAANSVEQAKHPSLVDIIASIDTPEGKRRTREYLASQPFPHFEAAFEPPGYLVRIDADGTRTVGRFVDQTFVAKSD